MNTRLVCAALAAAAVLCQSLPALATCVIAPDGKSIDVVTDNGSSDEKSCAVACKVDTKIGVVNVGCGGTTPPLAKGHLLCNFDKPEAWYKKVVSFEDSCKGGAAAARRRRPRWRPSSPAPSSAGFLPTVIPSMR